MLLTYFSANDTTSACGTATITLTVYDINDVVFSQDTYTACIQDKATTGKWRECIGQKDVRFKWPVRMYVGQGA